MFDQIVILMLAAINAATVAYYYLDKQAAKTGGQRTPEKVLHLLAVAGGWPGAFIGQKIFRHKTKKRAFRLIYWCTAVANCAALAVTLKLL